MCKSGQHSSLRGKVKARQLMLLQRVHIHKIINIQDILMHQVSNYGFKSILS